MRKMINLKSKRNSHFDFNHRNNLLKSKCSQGHVEMIISFVVFVGFVTTLLILLNPTKTNQINYTILDITEQKLLEEWEIEYGTISITLSSSAKTLIGSNDCFEINVVGLGINGNVVAKDSVYATHEAELQGDVLRVGYDSSESFYKIYFSEDLDQDDITGCTALTSDLYTTGTVNNQNAILYENIVDVVNRYDNDYDGLKQELELQNDFTFSVFNQLTKEEMINATIFIPRITEVVARDIPVVAINKDIDLSNLIINIRAW
jgi:hypothetical protein